MVFGLFKGKNGSKDSDTLKIFYAADFHGSTICFKKFIGAAKFYGVDVLIYGGDFVGQGISPIAEQDDGTWIAQQDGTDIRLTTEGEVDEFIQRATNMGLYPVRVTESELQQLAQEPERQDRLLRELAVERVREWAEYASEKLEGTGVQLVTIPGSEDPPEIDEILQGYLSRPD